MSYSTNVTIIKYQDTALPLTNTPVTLFNSATAFPPGGSFHLLAQQWFQYTIAIGTAAGAEAGTVTGAFSEDKGVTWVQFYSKATTTGVGTGIVSNEDEVFVAMYKDVRFQFNQTLHDTTVFKPQLALNPSKSSSTRTSTDVLI